MFQIYKFLKPYRSNIMGVFIFTFIQIVSQLYLPTLMSDIVDVGIVNEDVGYISKLATIMLLVAVLGMISAAISRFLSAKTGAGFSKKLRGEVFQRVESFSLKEMEQFGVATLITRTTNDITQVEQIITMILRMMFRAVMMCIGGIAMAVSKDIVLSMVIIVAIPSLTVFIGKVAYRVMPFFHELQKNLDKLNLVFREGLTGIRVVRAFNRTKYEQGRFEDTNKGLMNLTIKVNRLMVMLRPTMMLILNMTMVAVIWFGSIRVDKGAIQVGDLMAFIQYIMQILFSMIMVSMMFVMIPRAFASAKRIEELLVLNSQVEDQKGNKEQELKSSSISFDNVTFGYEGAKEPVLKNISFQANDGEVTAIIGGTGCGKSTLLGLALGFFYAQEGCVLVGGVNVERLSKDILRQKMGFVPQRAVLFTGTIIDNIRYGKQAATQQEVKNAADIAQATDFIEDMKDGFESLVSQAGTNLSGGQKQRLCIARAVVRKPEIYLFDDSFSALDFKTDAKLRQALKKETQGATIIIVAQRVSTVINADRIIVLDGGRVKGVGTHKELLSNCEVYQEIVHSQLSKEEWV